MAMRDLIPWGRQDTSPAICRDEERSPFLSLRKEVDRLFDDFFRAPMPGFGFGRSPVAWPSLEVKEMDNEVRIPINSETRH